MGRVLLLVWASAAACVPSGGSGSSGPEDCVGGRDEDGDDLVDCEDPDCAAEALCGWCPHAELPSELTASVESTTEGMPNTRSTSLCGNYEGPDATIAYTPPEGGGYIFTVTSASRRENYYLLEGDCSTGERLYSCNGGGYPVYATLDVGYVVTLVVESPEEAAGPFEVDVRGPRYSGSNRCIHFDSSPSTNFCATDCDSFGGCPAGFECIGVDTGAAAWEGCAPIDESCDGETALDPICDPCDTDEDCGGVN